MTAHVTLLPGTQRSRTLLPHALPQASSAKLRLTRRGRLVFGGLATACVAGALAFAAMVGATGAVASQEQSVQEFPYVLALPGDSLWTIAAALDPAADPRDVVDEIVRLNQMTESGVQAGEAFAVPVRYADTELTFPASELEG
ncbi:MAG: hypothetical protein ACTIJ6_06545 [Leucobacter sp.]